MRSRRALIVFPVVLALLGGLTPAGGRTAPTRLKAGESAFWTGPHLKEGSGRAFTYSFRVVEKGYRLRIGLDKPEIGDSFQARIHAPGGGEVGTATVAEDLYSTEWMTHNPKKGMWHVRVEALSATDTSFRVRAKLEKRPPRVGRGRAVVEPNLQILPPHDASFLVPVTNGLQGGESVGIDAAGLGSCHAEEYAEDRAVRCLRFAYGIRNTGKGPMDLHHSGPTGTEHTLFQTLYRANGSSFEREAGVAVFHKTHGHYHHSEAAGLQLFKVTDRKKGKLEAASAKRSKGFAHRNELLREWNRFYPTPMMRGFGLLPGWADIYEWDRPGNYIDFGLNGDGFYVVRMKADPVNGIRESNERDNFGYTYLKVTGSTVKWLEAGRGRDPWDPCKIEMAHGGHPDPKRTRRPAHCAKDTV